MADTIKIGGIKLSGEMVQVDLREPKAPAEILPGILHHISSEKINLPHLHQGRVNGEIQTTICFEALEYHRLESMLATELNDIWSRILPSVGTLSLFPHGSDIGFVATVYAIFAEENIPIHGISSSVSALVVHTDYNELDRAVLALLKVYELPENHSPLYPELRIEQVEE